MLDPDHNLEPGTYNVTIAADYPYGFPGTNNTNTVQVLYDGLVPKPKPVELVVVANRPPLAYTDPIQLVPAGQPVILNGTTSWDPDGNHLTYKWWQTGGANVTLVGDASPTPVSDAPDSQHTQTFTFELVVNDGSVDSQPFTTILVMPDTG